MREGFLFPSPQLLWLPHPTVSQDQEELRGQGQELGALSSEQEPGREGLPVSQHPPLSPTTTERAFLRSLLLHPEVSLPGPLILGTWGGGHAGWYPDAAPGLSPGPLSLAVLAL